MHVRFSYILSLSVINCHPTSWNQSKTTVSVKASNLQQSLHGSKNQLTSGFDGLGSSSFAYRSKYPTRTSFPKPSTTKILSVLKLWQGAFYQPKRASGPSTLCLYASDMSIHLCNHIAGSQAEAGPEADPSPIHPQLHPAAAFSGFQQIQICRINKADSYEQT